MSSDHNIYVSKLKDQGVECKYNDIVLIVGPSNCGKTKLLNDIHYCSNLYWNRKYSNFYAIYHTSAVEVSEDVLDDYDIESPPFVSMFADLSNRLWKPLYLPVSESQYDHPLRFLYDSLDISIKTNVESNRVQPQGIFGPNSPFNTNIKLPKYIVDAFFDVYGGTLEIVGVSTTRGELFLELTVKELNGGFLSTNMGSGIQAFVSLLFSIHSVNILKGTVLCIDEPESFLSLIDIRKLMSILLTFTGQIFIATHSPEVIRSTLDISYERSNILSINNEIKYCPSEDICSLFNDNLLRTSNAFEALFHNTTIIVEGDSDVRFYQRIIMDIDPFIDCVFIPAFNKDKEVKLWAPLTNLLNYSSIRLVYDIDFLSYSNFEKICENLSDDKSTELGKLFKSFRRYLKLQNGKNFHKCLKKFGELIWTDPSWTDLKGSHWEDTKWKVLRESTVVNDYYSLKHYLNESGIYTLPVGELESWVPQLEANKSNFISKFLDEYDGLKNEGLLTKAIEFTKLITEESDNCYNPLRITQEDINS